MCGLLRIEWMRSHRASKQAEPLGEVRNDHHLSMSKTSHLSPTPFSLISRCQCPLQPTISTNPRFFPMSSPQEASDRQEVQASIANTSPLSYTTRPKRQSFMKAVETVSRVCTDLSRRRKCIGPAATAPSSSTQITATEMVDDTGKRKRGRPRLSATSQPTNKDSSSNVEAEEKDIAPSVNATSPVASEPKPHESATIASRSTRSRMKTGRGTHQKLVKARQTKAAKLARKVEREQGVESSDPTCLPVEPDSRASEQERADKGDNVEVVVDGESGQDEAVLNEETQNDANNEDSRQEADEQLTGLNDASAASTPVTTPFSTSSLTWSDVDCSIEEVESLLPAEADAAPAAAMQNEHVKLSDDAALPQAAVEASADEQSSDPGTRIPMVTPGEVVAHAPACDDEVVVRALLSLSAANDEATFSLSEADMPAVCAGSDTSEDVAPSPAATSQLDERTAALDKLASEAAPSRSCTKETEESTSADTDSPSALGTEEAATVLPSQAVTPAVGTGCEALGDVAPTSPANGAPEPSAGEQTTALCIDTSTNAPCDVETQLPRSNEEVVDPTSDERASPLGQAAKEADTFTSPNEASPVVDTVCEDTPPTPPALKETVHETVSVVNSLGEVEEQLPTCTEEVSEPHLAERASPLAQAEKDEATLSSSKEETAVVGTVNEDTSTPPPNALSVQCDDSTILAMQGEEVADDVILIEDATAPPPPTPRSAPSPTPTPTPLPTLRVTSNIDRRPLTEDPTCPQTDFYIELPPLSPSIKSKSIVIPDDFFDKPSNNNTRRFIEDSSDDEITVVESHTVSGRKRAKKGKGRQRDVEADTDHAYERLNAAVAGLDCEHSEESVESDSETSSDEDTTGLRRSKRRRRERFPAATIAMLNAPAPTPAKRRERAVSRSSSSPTKYSRRGRPPKKLSLGPSSQPLQLRRQTPQGDVRRDRSFRRTNSTPTYSESHRTIPFAHRGSRFSPAYFPSPLPSPSPLRRLPTPSPSTLRSTPYYTASESSQQALLHDRIRREVDSVLQRCLPEIVERATQDLVRASESVSPQLEELYLEESGYVDTQLDAIYAEESESGDSQLDELYMECEEAMEAAEAGQLDDEDDDTSAELARMSSPLDSPPGSFIAKMPKDMERFRRLSGLEEYRTTT